MKRSDIKYFLTIYFLTETTKNCANFVGSLLVLQFLNYFFLIFKICTFQWLNCTNMKDELNRSYNGEGVVYLLQSELSRSSIQYAMQWHNEASYCTPPGGQYFCVCSNNICVCNTKKICINSEYVLYVVSRHLLFELNLFNQVFQTDFLQYPHTYYH